MLCSWQQRWPKPFFLLWKSTPITAQTREKNSLSSLQKESALRHWGLLDAIKEPMRSTSRSPQMFSSGRPAGPGRCLTFCLIHSTCYFLFLSSLSLAPDVFFRIPAGGLMCFTIGWLQEVPLRCHFSQPSRLTLTNTFSHSLLTTLVGPTVAGLPLGQELGIGKGGLYTEAGWNIRPRRGLSDHLHTSFHKGWDQKLREGGSHLCSIHPVSRNSHRKHSVFI